MARIIKFGIGAVGIAATGLALVAAPAQAAAPADKAAVASPADCVGGANGFVDIPDTLRGTVQRRVDLSARVAVTLESGTVAGRQRGWGRIGGINGGVLEANNKVWMDVSQDGGRTWLQCGPFGGSTSGPLTTPAAYTTGDANRKFRACGTLAVEIKCTGWW
ncbi:hypothetical protein [Spirillospora sp. CA-294931]|uniref:hypothetical protein n=1 Tax=Spirillospora sp. CA-294931 TaxID=3240042 RepID=UPI003D9319DB